MIEQDKAIGERVSTYRGKLSQAALADRMVARGHAFSQTTIYKIEYGHRRLSLSEGADLAAVLGVPVAALVAEDMDPEDTSAQLAAAKNALSWIRAIADRAVGE